MGITTVKIVGIVVLWLKMAVPTIGREPPATVGQPSKIRL